MGNQKKSICYLTNGNTDIGWKILKAKCLRDNDNYNFTEIRFKELLDDTIRINFIADPTYDILVLPLSLPKYLSLRIAEEVHLLNSRLKLFLCSGTMASPDVLLPLFDVFNHTVSLKDIIALIDIEQPKRILDKSELDILIQKVLEDAACFLIKLDLHSHDPGRQPSLSDYRKVKDIQSQDRILQEASSKIRKREQIFYINNVSNYNIRQAGAVGPNSSAQNNNFSQEDSHSNES